MGFIKDTIKNTYDFAKKELSPDIKRISKNKKIKKALPKFVKYKKKKASQIKKEVFGTKLNINY